MNVTFVSIGGDRSLASARLILTDWEMVEISVTSPAALASGENAPHHIVWSAWHSWVMSLSGRLYHACLCWRQWHQDRQIEEAWSFRSMYVLSKSAKWIIFFVFCVDFEAVFRHVPFTARLGNVDFWILRLRFYKEKSHWCLQWLAVWCGLLLLWKGRQEACVRRSLHALMEWPEDAGDDFPREICCGAGVPFRLFLTALNQADDAATLPKDCSSRLPLSNGLSVALGSFRIKDAQGLTWGALHVCHGSQRWAHVGSSKAFTAMLTVFFFFFFSSISSTPWTLECSTRFLDVTFVVDRVFFSMAKVNCCCIRGKESVQRAANGCVDFNLVQS